MFQYSHLKIINLIFKKIFVILILGKVERSNILSMKYNTTTIKNDIAYGITDTISPIRNRIDELEDRVTKLEEKGDTVQRKTKHRRIVIKL